MERVRLRLKFSSQGFRVYVYCVVLTLCATSLYGIPKIFASRFEERKEYGAFEACLYLSLFLGYCVVPLVFVVATWACDWIRRKYPRGVQGGLRTLMLSGILLCVGSGCTLGLSLDGPLGKYLFGYSWEPHCWQLLILPWLVINPMLGCMQLHAVETTLAAEVNNS